MIKNITLSAEETLVEQARRRANAEHTTINRVFREWLSRYVAQPSAADGYEAVMRRLRHARAGRKFGREEMHERR